MPDLFGRRPPAVRIRRGPYAMEMADGENAEITMYGEIVESQPVDYWTGKPVEGSYIVQDKFLEDLKALEKAKSITIRMNSVGGDAGVSVLIHNKLRELSAKGTALVCVVDGVAMSGGSLIMCACDQVRVNPSSIIMIHKCWSLLFGCYNAEELREEAAKNEAWDKAQASIYRRKTGLSEAEISGMMAETTYMTGTEAVEKGFADQLIEDAEPLDIAASADGRSLFVRGRRFHLTPGMFAPDSIPTAPPETPAAAENENGGRTMAKTLEELKKEDPALAESLLAEAKASLAPDGGGQALDERKRLQEIDALAGVMDPETIRAAKYESPCTAQEMVYQAAQKASQQGRKFLAALEADSGDSGAQAVGPADGGGENGDSPQAMLAQAKADAQAFNKRRKEVR